MKRHARIVPFVAVATLLWLSFPVAVCSNAAEPPTFTIMVSNPPDDLSLSLRLPNDRETEAIVLQSERRAWETYYRFFNSLSPSRHDSLNGAVLVVQSSERSFECPLPAATFRSYNNLLTLDLETGNLTVGQSPFRVPALVALRVLLTLLIEGAVFFLFGYRKRRSWLAFLAVNLVTQGALNALFTGPDIGSYWMIGFVVGEIVVLAVETATLVGIISEHTRRRTVFFVLSANAASLLLGGQLIARLPI